LKSVVVGWFMGNLVNVVVKANPSNQSEAPPSVGDVAGTPLRVDALMKGKYLCPAPRLNGLSSASFFLFCIYKSQQLDNEGQINVF